MGAVGEHWGELERKGLVAGHIAPECDGSQVVLTRRPGAVASSPALHSDGGPAGLSDAAHSPTAALAGAGMRVPVGWRGKQSTHRKMAAWL